VRPESLASAFRSSLQGFVRQFGLLLEDETPCGVPIPPSEAHALLVLRERNGDALRHKDLTEALGLDKSSVARLCGRLERRGHVLQERSDSDGRARNVVLTAKGRRLADQLEEASRLRFERLLKAISAEERDGVVRAVAVLRDAATTLGKRETE
jgi:DNA-binding MarR family transcriptional regulator